MIDETMKLVEKVGWCYLTVAVEKPSMSGFSKHRVIMEIPNMQNICFEGQLNKLPTIEGHSRNRI